MIETCQKLLGKYTLFVLMKLSQKSQMRHYCSIVLQSGQYYYIILQIIRYIFTVYVIEKGCRHSPRYYFEWLDEREDYFINAA